MTQESLTKILSSLAVIAVLAGCAAAPVPYEVRDSQGHLVVSRAVEADRPEALMQSLHSAFVEGDYERCRGLAAVARDAWSESAEIVTAARRMAAWCLLFTYERERASISALKNEARNLRILDDSLAEFHALSGRYMAEARVIERVVIQRVLDLEAFEHTLAALRRASRADSDAARRTAIAKVGQEFPQWSAETRLDALSQFPWNTTEAQQ